MPSSRPDHLTMLCEAILSSGAQNALDVGIGFGKWGILAREYLDVYHGRVYPSEWRAEITGVEAWERYREGAVSRGLVYDRCIYSTIQDALHGPLESSYDIIIACDVIEHIDKAEAVEVARSLWNRCSGRMLVTLPVGPGWLGNTIVDGNEYERHRSEWGAGELATAIGWKCKSIVSGPKGSEIEGMVFER